MMGEGITFEGPPGNHIDQRMVSEPLEAGQYERVAEILHQAQAASEQTNDTVQADIFAAAYQVCLALATCQAEVVWHQQAFEKASQQEHKLKQRLQALLDLAVMPDAPEKRTRLYIPPRPATQPVKHLGLWRRTQRLFRRQPSSRSPEREALAPVEEDQPTVVLPLEKIETPLSLLTEAEVPATPSTEETARPPLSPVELSGQKPEEPGPPSLIVYCLGPFQVYQDDQPLEDWPNSKGKLIFKYLITHRERPIAKEILMDLFWPDTNPDAARNNLNVTIYSLRQILRKIRPDFPHILFQDDCYLFNSELQIWVDVEEFIKRFNSAQNLEQRGELALMVREYSAAETLYQGEFLEEDRYEDWLMPQRQTLQDTYLSLLDRLSRYYLDRADYATCVTMCGKMLAIDSCHEEAYRRLMRCYARQGQRNLALRQYHLYVEALKAELDVPPSQTTTTLYKQIRQGQQI